MIFNKEPFILQSERLVDYFASSFGDRFSAEDIEAIADAYEAAVSKLRVKALYIRENVQMPPYIGLLDKLMLNKGDAP
ncbi:hypothetical protein [Bradyrhizobium sp. STM 3557]|uniref:hypothetical protein n=1 Tax=Bradyrhizobium sp. STM 3557 TaxID=578920 RepID=UPI00388FD4BD